MTNHHGHADVSEQSNTNQKNPQIAQIDTDFMKHLPSSFPRPYSVNLRKSAQSADLTA